MPYHRKPANRNNMTPEQVREMQMREADRQAGLNFRSRGREREFEKSTNGTLFGQHQSKPNA